MYFYLSPKFLFINCLLLFHLLLSQDFLHLSYLPIAPLDVCNPHTQTQGQSTDLLLMTFRKYAVLWWNSWDILCFSYHYRRLYSPTSFYSRQRSLQIDCWFYQLNLRHPSLIHLVQPCCPMKICTWFKVTWRTCIGCNGFYSHLSSASWVWCRVSLIEWCLTCFCRCRPTTSLYVHLHPSRWACLRCLLLWEWFCPSHSQCCGRTACF